MAHSVEIEVELVLDARAALGEGPVWDARSKELVWVAITDGSVHRFDPTTGADRRIEVGQHVGAAALRQAGGLVLAVRDGFAFLYDDGTVELAVPCEADVPARRMNDGKVDSHGRFWAGTLSYDGTPGQASLYRLDPDGAVTRAVSGLTLSNGLGWSPDDRSFYLIDSTSHGIDVFEFDADTAILGDRRRLRSIPTSDAMPDGMTVDAEGFLWVALWGGWCVQRLAPDGTLDAVVPLPVAQPTSCTFGGDDLRDLYITSAAQDLEADALAGQPHAGGVFRCRPGVAGLPANAYAG